ncbi:MAG: TolC family protein [Elusimicrobiota bacterium]
MKRALGLIPLILIAAAPLRPSEIPLTADAAVEVALSRAPALKAARARAQAEKAAARAAGRPEEPKLIASHEAGHGDGRTQMALTFDLWSLIGLSGRGKASAAEFRRADAELAETALALAANTKSAVYAVQAASATVVLLRERAASNLEAGDAEQAAIDAERAEADLEAARSRLARLMRVPANSGWWTAATMARPADADPDTASLALLARERRPSLKAALAAADAAEQRARAWSSSEAGAFRVGVASEKMPDGSRLTGPAVEMDIPLFATMVPRAEAAEARAAEAAAQADDLDAELTSQLEILRARLIAARRAAKRCREGLIPARESARGRDAAGALLAARLEEISALKDYWTTYAALEGAVGGTWETK